MSSLKLFFLQRRPSEKMLLTAFLAIGLVIWISSFWTRASAFTDSANKKRADLKEQKFWIDQEAKIEKVTADALSTLRPEKSLTSTGLVSRLQSIGQGAGLGNQNLKVNSGVDTRSPQFTLHTAQVQITNLQNSDAGWGMVQKFYQDLLKESPYMTLQAPYQTTMSAGGGGRGGGNGTISAVFNVSAVEMKSR